MHPTTFGFPLIRMPDLPVIPSKSLQLTILFVCFASSVVNTFEMIPLLTHHDGG
jgi:hypothetical protein